MRAMDVGIISMKPLYQRLYRVSGFTLIEIMIVVALMALMLGVGIFGLGIIGRADVNGEAVRFGTRLTWQRRRTRRFSSKSILRTDGFQSMSLSSLVA